MVVLHVVVLYVGDSMPQNTAVQLKLIQSKTNFIKENFNDFEEKNNYEAESEN